MCEMKRATKRFLALLLTAALGLSLAAPVRAADTVESTPPKRKTAPLTLLALPLR